MARTGLTFEPSRVEGLPHVTEVAVHPQELALFSGGEWVCYRFAEIAHWPTPGAFWRAVSMLGWRPKQLYVGERDWFHPPAERFFRFFTTPPITVYLADEPAETDYGSTLFQRVLQVIAEGGFWTYDLG